MIKMCVSSYSIYLEYPDGVNVGRSRSPATEEDNGGPLEDVPLLTSLLQSSQKSLVDVLEPVGADWGLVE